MHVVQDDDAQVSEERRLLYVAMTRARRSLVMSHADARAIFGMLHPRAPSRFLSALSPSLATRKRAVTLAEPLSPAAAVRGARTYGQGESVGADGALVDAGWQATSWGPSAGREATPGGSYNKDLPF